MSERLEEAGADGESVGRSGARRRRRLRRENGHPVGGRVGRLDGQLLVRVERLNVGLQDGPRVSFGAMPTRLLLPAAVRRGGRWRAEFRARHRQERRVARAAGSAATGLLDHNRRVGRLHDHRLRAACKSEAHQIVILYTVNTVIERNNTVLYCSWENEKRKEEIDDRW